MHQSNIHQIKRNVVENVNAATLNSWISVNR